jgi:hypothetical protein
MKTEAKEIKGFYGGYKTPCTVFIYDGWYAVEGSQNVNHTSEPIEEGVWVEELQDNDMFTWSKGIDSLDELIEAVES